MKSKTDEREDYLECNMECIFTKFHQELEETLERKIAGGCTASMLACRVASVPFLPMGISGMLQRFFWQLGLHFLASIKFWAIFCFIQCQIRSSSWMLALDWEMETICAAMKEAFCIWQDL